MLHKCQLKKLGGQEKILPKTKDSFVVVNSTSCEPPCRRLLPRINQIFNGKHWLLDL